MKGKENLVFLYTRLADYFYQCVVFYCASRNKKAVIVSHPLDKNAPYEYRSTANVTIKFRDEFSDASLEKFVDDQNPAFIFITGWVDKGYKNIGKKYKKTIPVVMGMDNQWHNTLRQRIGLLASRFVIRNFNNYIWVAGEPQAQFASKLGFYENQIMRNLYCAHLERFEKEPEQVREKSILFVGRFIEVKGIIELIQSFLEIEKGLTESWKLKIVGKGPLKYEISQYIEDRIELVDFVQPQQLATLYKSATAFCLPSHFEPWGVALHEAAACGLVLIASTACGAATAFIEEGKNGFKFETGNQKALGQSLEKLLHLTENELYQMGIHSEKLSQKITHEKWASTIDRLIKNE